ncbi:hypothetical protein CYFUS_003061 [Cystobacter fuscus]|uniref:BNR repeat domain protein n=1 Tax=Cystobacter fuscus TaxID=43 RepID=A0A250J398_9BACT|nr:hypothetical protein [Cystobacter fuscus]ATB37636.1 hypothetical protein CYFUS_003061 [Cystobacter fuscus]
MRSSARWWLIRLLGVWLGVLWMGCGQSGPGGVSDEGEEVQGSSLLATRARARIAAGTTHSLAVRPDGTVWATGGNGHGQLGDGTTLSRRVPVQVQGLSGVAAVATGQYHSLAVRSDGTVWAWGNNDLGQLGAQPSTYVTTAVRSLLY